jgi:RRXRR protein
MRIPVISIEGQPLMPTTPARARKWIESGKAVKKWSDVGLFYVQLVNPPSDTKIQPIVIGGFSE